MGRSGPHLIHGSLSTPESKSKTASQSVQPFLHSSRQSVVWHVRACPFPLKLSLFTRGSVPHLIRVFLDPPDWASQTASRSVQPFLHSSRQTVTILYNERPFPLNCPSHRGIWAPSNTWFLGPIHPTPSQTACRSIQPFFTAHRRAPYTLQWNAPFPPLKIATYHGGYRPPPNGSLAPPESSIGMASPSV